jgi:hypothetical protein
MIIGGGYIVGLLQCIATVRRETDADLWQNNTLYSITNYIAGSDAVYGSLFNWRGEKPRFGQRSVLCLDSQTLGTI